VSKILRLAVVLAMSLAALLGTTSLASAAPPTTAEKAYAKCVAEKTVAALKLIDKQTWKNKAAREAAVRAAVEKAKADCKPKPTYPHDGQATYYLPLQSATFGPGTHRFEFFCDPDDWVSTFVTESYSRPGGWHFGSTGPLVGSTGAKSGYYGEYVNTGSDDLTIEVRGHCVQGPSPL